MSRFRIGKYHARPEASGSRAPLWWVLLAPIVRRSRRARAFFYELRRSRFRTAAVVHYYRDIVEDIGTGDVRRHASAIDPDACVDLFGMERFRGPEGAQEAVEHWHASFPGLRMQMSEFINPEGPYVVCLTRVAGGGATSGANVTLDVAFTVKVEDGQAVELSLSDDSRAALASIGLRP